MCFGLRKFFLTAGFLLFIPSSVFCQSTEFTFQGNLVISGTPANVSHDFEFLLFDALSGGTQLGTTQTRLGVAVANGVFSVQLDFGNQFPGAGRFLEIRVRPSGGGAFTPLSPRQKVNSAPYSVRSLNAVTADNVSVGGIPSGSNNYIQNRTTSQLFSNFHIDGNGTVGGTLSGNVVSTGAQYNIGSSRVLGISVPGNLFVGIQVGEVNSTGADNSFFGQAAGNDNTTGSLNSFFGRETGKSNTTGFSNSFFGARAGIANTTGAGNSFFGHSTGTNSIANNNSFFGYLAGNANTTGSGNSGFGTRAGISNISGSGNTIIGYTADVGGGDLINATAIGSRAFVSQSDSLVLGSISSTNGAITDTKVGIGTTAPVEKLEVKNGTILNSGNTGGGFMALNPNNQAASVSLGWFDEGALDWPRLRYGGTGEGSSNGFLIQGPGDNVKLRVFHNGDLRLGGGCVQNSSGTAIAGSCASDLRFKKDITPISDVLSRFVRLRPVDFYWRADEFESRLFGSEQSYGLVAQEVETLFPELVSTDAEGFKSVDYSKLPLITIQAVREQQAEIELQRVENAKLRSVLEQLRRYVCEKDATAPFCKNK